MRSFLFFLLIFIAFAAMPGRSHAIDLAGRRAAIRETGDRTCLHRRNPTVDEPTQPDIAPVTAPVTVQEAPRHPFRPGIEAAIVLCTSLCGIGAGFGSAVYLQTKSAK
jgi:hypothetical protein